MSELQPSPIDLVVARIKNTYGRWRRDTPVIQMRADWDALFPARGEARSDDVTANGVPCRWVCAPGAREDRVVMYFHGGGFQIGSLDSHHELMSVISRASGARVLGVGYRLAPEHRFPAPVQDALAAFEWLRAGGLPARHMAVAGDSAGGGLALSLMLALQQKGNELPAAAYLLSAWTDLTAGGSSYETRASMDPINQRRMVAAMAQGYLGAADASDPLASPLFAPASRLASLPPLLLQVGEHETVLSDSEDFARKARLAGVDAELQVWPGMIHVFQQFPSALAAAREAVAQGGRFLARHLQVENHRESLP